MRMEEFQEVFSKIILIKNPDLGLKSLVDEDVVLEIDAAYKIGKSVAVLLGDQVIGHIPRFMAKSTWLHLKLGRKLQGKVYGQLDNGFKNSICFSMLSKAQEVGIRLRFFFPDHFDGTKWVSGSTDAKLFLFCFYLILH